MHAFDRRAIAASFASNGFLRRSPWTGGGRPGHREWLHFSVRDRELQLLVNISAVDDLRPAAAPHRERVRVLALVHDGERWDGDLDEIAAEECALRGGQLDLRAGATVAALDGSTLRLRGALRRRPLAFDLALTPRAFPSVATNVALGAEAPINWLVVPHLAASGTVTVRDRTFTLAAAPAYHDHNWGYFSHRDFAWQWGHATDPGGHSVVLARLLDRPHATVFMQSLLVWRDGRQVRVFRGDELEVRPEGFLRPVRPFTVPSVGTLLVGARATEVPRRLHVTARADGDILAGVFEAEDVARITVPHDHDLGTTVIHEVTGRLVLGGELHGQRFEVDVPAMFEFLGSTP